PVFRALINRRIPLVRCKPGETGVNQKLCVVVMPVSGVEVHDAGDPADGIQRPIADFRVVEPLVEITVRWTSVAYNSHVICNCRTLFKHWVRAAASLARDRADRSSAARIPMMAMTTRSSIRVKAKSLTRRESLAQALNLVPFMFLKLPASS